MSPLALESPSASALEDAPETATRPPDPLGGLTYRVLLRIESPSKVPRSEAAGMICCALSRRGLGNLLLATSTIFREGLVSDKPWTKRLRD